jgi:hypothetical protein
MAPEDARAGCSMVCSIILRKWTFWQCQLYLAQIEKDLAHDWMHDLIRISSDEDGA